MYQETTTPNQQTRSNIPQWRAVLQALAARKNIFWKLSINKKRRPILGWETHMGMGELGYGVHVVEAGECIDLQTTDHQSTANCIIRLQWYLLREVQMSSRYNMRLRLTCILTAVSWHMTADDAFNRRYQLLINQNNGWFTRCLDCQPATKLIHGGDKLTEECKAQHPV